MFYENHKYQEESTFLVAMLQVTLSPKFHFSFKIITDPEVVAKQ